ncbi:MAG: hypothetical protein ACXABY_16865, partial [Candidatus Thorarchaeota archaeon]
MAYLTWRSYVRSGPVCLGALMVIAGAIIALLPSIDAAYDFIPGMTVYIGAAVAVLGLIFILVGFFFTKRKRDSVLAPVDIKVDDT